MPITLVRLTHIAAALYNLLFVYSPLHDWVHGLTVVQYVSMPLLVLSGVLMARARKQPQAA